MGVPTLCTDKSTSGLYGGNHRWMNVQLAPTISVHGVLVDVFGEGVSDYGRERHRKKRGGSGTHQERGHRLVTDDVVEISKVSDATLVGIRPGYYPTFY